MEIGLGTWAIIVLVGSILAIPVSLGVWDAIREIRHRNTTLTTRERKMFDNLYGDLNKEEKDKEQNWHP